MSETRAESSRGLLHGPVHRVLLSMSVPIGLGMLSTFLFQVVDTYFVGKLGEEELAALSFTSPVYLLLMAAVIGLAGGVATVVAKALGGGDNTEARGLASLALIFIGGASVLACAAGAAYVGPTFRILGAGPEVGVLAGDYMRILYTGMPLVMTGLVGGAILRARGETRGPEVVMIVAGGLNLVFDALLIFGYGPFPRLGLQGAATATVLSWLFVFFAMAALVFRRRALGIAGLTWARIVSGYRRLLGVGLPVVLTQLLAPATSAFLTFLVARQGDEAVAGFGVASRVQALALVGVFGVSTAITPFIAQNLGARQPRRIDEAVVFAGKASVYWGLGVFVLLVAFAGPIGRVFSGSTEVQEVTRLYFYVVAGTYAPFGLLSVTAAIFNGILEPGKALRILFVKAIVLTAPLAWLGSAFGVLGIFAGLAVSNLLGAAFAARMMKRHLASSGSPLSARSPWRDYAGDLSALAGCRS